MLEGRVVSLEVNDDGSVEVFRQAEDGSIISERDTHRFWALAPNTLNRSAVRLNGALHYKYGYVFESRDGFNRFCGYNKSKDIYTIWNNKESYMVRNAVNYYEGLKQVEVSVFSFDLETTSLKHDDSAKILLISTYYRDKKGSERRLFSYDDYEDESKMLLAFSSYLRNLDPSILIGHNVVSYDIPYMNYCAKRAGIKLEWGRDGSPLKIEQRESKFRKDGSQFIHYHKCHIYGREIVDTMFLAIKYDIQRKYINYRLKNLIEQSGLEAEDRVFYDASQIRHNYKDPIEYAKIKAYCEFDAEDAVKLWDLMGPTMFYLAPVVPKPFQMIIESASGAQINSMAVSHYLSQGHSIPKADEAVSYQGAISLGNPGIYKSVSKLDIKSLYPSIMLTYNVFPKEKDPLGYLEGAMKNSMKGRLEMKNKYKETGDEYYNSQDAVLKGQLNSYYGFFGAQGLNFNFPAGAALITEHGRNILLKSIYWATGEDYTSRITKVEDAEEVEEDSI